MIFQCYKCDLYSFEEICPRCGETSIELYIPLDPKYFREFRYTSQGIIHDILFKKHEVQALESKLISVLDKYAKFKHPYFVNFLHLYRRSLELSNPLEAEKMDSRLILFHQVLTRLGFDELREFPNLTQKLVMSTDFDFDYSNFVSQIKHHMKGSLHDSVYSWIEEKGALFRKELPLFMYYLWQNGLFLEEIHFSKTNPNKSVYVPVLNRDSLISIYKWCEQIYTDIQIRRFQTTLEGFNPEDYINIYYIDSMNGATFEDFLVSLFSCLGYEVEETRRSHDQGADLFLKRFDKRIVVQAKNYIDNVGNVAVQQALAAMSFYSCDEAMVVTNSYFTTSAIELAKATSVKLVDRDLLIQYIDEYNEAIIEQRSHSQRATE